MAYTSAAEVIEFSRLKYGQLGFETEDEFESWVSTLLPLAEGLIEDFCKVPRSFFEGGGYTQTNGLYDYRETWIHLKYRPVISITKVEVDTGSYGDTADWKELSADTGYVVAADRALLKIVGDVTPQVMLQTVKVTYVAGYTVTPQPIKIVCMQLISNMLHEMLQRRLAPIVRVDDFAIRMVIPKAFTKDLQEMLDPYVHHEVYVG